MVDVIVATDIGARGLDMPEISHVISFNVPKDHQDYIHRAGRTGRAGESGKSIILAAEDEVGRVRHIEHALNSEFKRIKRLLKGSQRSIQKKRVKTKPNKKEKRGKTPHKKEKNGKRDRIKQGKNRMKKRKKTLSKKRRRH